jgi:predicted nucleic acid-binding protein
MRYLLDTNVVSEPGKPRPSAAVLRWLGGVASDEVAVSVMTLGELRKGAAQLRTRDASRANALDEWIAETVAQFGNRIIPVDLDIADVWGELEATEPRPKVDGLIAATALVRGWVVATRNIKDFERMGVQTYNPFEAA